MPVTTDHNLIQSLPSLFANVSIISPMPRTPLPLSNEDNIVMNKIKVHLNYMFVTLQDHSCLRLHYVC